MKHKSINYLIATCVILIGTVLAVIVFFSLQARQVLTSYMESIHPVSVVAISVDGGETEEISLPAKLTDLAPRTPVTLTTTVKMHPGDSLLFKSVFAPVQLYIDDILTYESGQPDSSPSYMNDPPTILTTIPLPDKEGTVELRIEYLSLTQRNNLSLPALSVGNRAELLANQFRTEGPSLFFSLLLILLGLTMTLGAVTVIWRGGYNVPFLWLGLFSLSAGMWVLGECDLTAFLFPYPTLLYYMAYLGLFLVTIPFLCFGLEVLKPKNKLLLQIMLWLHIVSVSVTLLLQLLGRMDFTKSLYWFHIIGPLGFLLFALCLLWEHFRYHNPAAKRFAPAVILLTTSTLLEVANYWLNSPIGLTIFFQLGMLVFVISLIIVSDHYVREFMQSATEEKERLAYEMAATVRQLELQKLQYQKIAETNDAVKAQRHDLRHQFTVLRKLNEQGNREKLDRYLDTLTQKIPSGKETRLCENYVVNAVATYYASVAKEQNIQLKLQFAIPPDLDFLMESDLCIVVGNLLENTVEACTRMVEGERFIWLSSHLEYNVLTLTVDNSFDGNIRKKNGVFLSTKRESEGVGLPSVVAVAKKYSGAAQFESKDDVFQASVYMHLQNQASNT